MCLLIKTHGCHRIPIRLRLPARVVKDVRQHDMSETFILANALATCRSAWYSHEALPMAAKLSIGVIADGCGEEHNMEAFVDDILGVQEQ